MHKQDSKSEKRDKGIFFEAITFTLVLLLKKKAISINTIKDVRKKMDLQNLLELLQTINISHNQKRKTWKSLYLSKVISLPKLMVTHEYRGGCKNDPRQHLLHPKMNDFNFCYAVHWDLKMAYAVKTNI